MPGFEVIGAEELREIQDIFERGGNVLFRHGFDHLRNGVFKVRELERAFARYLGSAHALACSSGTAALKVALEALGVGPGDSVVTQAFTFVATVEAIIECGATPLIAEIDDTLNMDPRSLEVLIRPSTKAVIPVHMLGVPADMGRIMAVARAHGIRVIEDTAWGCGGAYAGTKLGAIGDLGAFSFDHAKAMTTGEGGMVASDNADLAFAARAYHDHGHHDNPALPRWEDSRHGSGFNYRMSELAGAVGLAQLRKLDAVIGAQRRAASLLEEAIADIEGIRVRPMPAGSEPTCDAFVFTTESHAMALACRHALLSRGLSTKILPEALSWHFARTWSHMPELVRASGGDLRRTLARSTHILERCVALPVSVKLDPTVLTRTREALREAIRGRA